MDSGFKPIEHTADLGLKVWAPTLEGLFRAAARGMFAFITPLDTVNPSDLRTVIVEGVDIESLLIAWLNELLFIHASEKMLIKDFSVAINLERFELKAECGGEKIDATRHQLRHEIKAATYSAIKIIKVKSLYKTTIIFDV